MKIKIIFFFLLTILVPRHAIADEIPALLLNEGTNEITFSLSNIWNRDINNLTFEVDEKKMPRWLSVAYDNTNLDILKGARDNTFVIIFDVDSAPSDAIADIPYSFKDNKGNVWSYSIHVKANTDDAGLEAFDSLYENFPNPFNPTTTIKYSLKESKHTKLVIYNSLGQVIRTLVNDVQDAGVHTIQWNGCDDYGLNVASGLYFYRLKAGSYLKTRRMMLIE